MRVWESLSAFPTYRMREWVQLLAIYRMQVGLLQVTQLESVRESFIYHVSANTSIVKTHTYCTHTHTHTRIARSLLQLREQISLTLLTHSQRKLDLCVSLSLTSVLRLLFFSTFCRCWSAVAQSVENALLLCVVRAAAAAHRVAKPVSAHAQRYVACLNLLPIIVNCNWQ